MKTYERKEHHPLGKEVHDAGPEPYSDEWYHEGDVKRKEHEQSHWGKGEGNKHGDVK